MNRSKKSNKQALGLLLSDRIDYFYQVAKDELAISAARYNSILKLYVVIDEQGNFLKEQVKGTEEWMMKGSYQDDHGTLILGQDNVRDKFNIEIGKLMTQEVKIDWKL